MNFQLPFFDDPSNFWLVIGAMVVFAVAILVAAAARAAGSERRRSRRLVAR